MRVVSGSVVRSAVVALVTLVGAVALALATTITSAVTLIAATPLIVPGTGTPRPQQVEDYLDNAVNRFIAPGGGCAVAGGCTAPVPVDYTAQFWPFPFAGWGGLQGAKWNDSVASGVTNLTTAFDTAIGPDGAAEVRVFGYSQGATVVSIFKKRLRDQSPGGVIPGNVSFFVIGNPNRPNGGLFERLAFLGTLPILDATFGNPTPTNTAPDGTTNTMDTALQYDAVADAPRYPLNALALLNGLAGFLYVHGTYLNPNGNNPDEPIFYGYEPAEVEAIQQGCRQDPTGPNCQVHGDTIYVTLPAKSLPIIQPFLDLAKATGTTPLIAPIAALVSPALQTLIETGYDRTDYGRPTPFGLIPRIDPVKLVNELAADIPEGIEDAIGVLHGIKPDLSKPNHAPNPLAPTTAAPQQATATPAKSQRPAQTPTEKASEETQKDGPTPDPTVLTPKEPQPQAEPATETRESASPHRPKVRHPVSNGLTKIRAGIANAVKDASDSLDSAPKPNVTSKPKSKPTVKATGIGEHPTRKHPRDKRSAHAAA